MKQKDFIKVKSFNIHLHWTRLIKHLQNFTILMLRRLNGMFCVAEEQTVYIWAVLWQMCGGYKVTCHCEWGRSKKMMTPEWWSGGKKLNCSDIKCSAWSSPSSSKRHQTNSNLSIHVFSPNPPDPGLICLCMLYTTEEKARLPGHFCFLGKETSGFV